MFANAAVEAGDKKHYLTLPQTAITYNPYGSTVFVVQTAEEAAAAAKAASAPAPAASGYFVQQAFVTRRDARRPGRDPQGPEGRPEVVTSGQLKLKNGTCRSWSTTACSRPTSPNPTPQEH
jgi:membrane fusion protein (multidrug efflux system)